MSAVGPLLAAYFVLSSLAIDVSTGDEFKILGRLLLAGLLGGLIGLERELRGYPAGIRTIALVALGSCLFTDISALLGGEDRIAAQIVTGIGFIGAGVIFREGYSVRGITTAATIWAAAAVGMAIGAELYIVGIAGAIAVFAILESRPLTRRIDELIQRQARQIGPEMEQAITANDVEQAEERRDD
ncbi:MAG: hypothetical protein E6J43_00905 [Chloroflexi bacterium]|nr:MAG: hypothetical protein E6J43_00905 [Chloroflexota bacterium]